MEDFNLDKTELVIRYGKGGKQRTLYLNDKCISAIKEYLKVRSENAGRYLFVTRESAGKDKKMKFNIWQVILLYLLPKYT